MVVTTLVSCGKKEEEDETVDQAIFFDIAYSTQASRIEGTTAYTRVEGTQEMLFVPDTGDDSTASNSGKFMVSFQNYKEPQLFNTGVCSGGYEGTFTMNETAVTDEDTTDAEEPYNPLNPYDPEVADGDTSEEDEDKEKVYSYIFNLAVTRRSLSSGCTSLSPLDAFSLRIIRYPNGDLIITNPSRSMEFYMIPKLK